MLHKCADLSLRLYQKQAPSVAVSNSLAAATRRLMQQQQPAIVGGAGSSRLPVVAAAAAPGVGSGAPVQLDGLALMAAKQRLAAVVCWRDAAAREGAAARRWVCLP